MKTKILFTLLGLFSLLNVKSQTCQGFGYKLDTTAYCWLTPTGGQNYFTISTINNTTRNDYRLWKRDQDSARWVMVTTIGTINFNSQWTLVTQQNLTQLTYITPPYPPNTLPNIAPWVFSSVISSNYNAVPTNTPYNNGACYSDTFKSVRINPVPAIVVNPDTTKRYYCKNSKSDALWCSALGPNNVIDSSNLRYKWYASNPNGSNFPSSSDTNRFFVPPTGISAGNSYASQSYYCVVTNSFGCGTKSKSSGLITVYDTVRTTTNISTCYNIPYKRYVGITNSGDTLRDTLRNGGTYIKHFTSKVTGCDSAAKLILTLTNNPTKTTTVSRCPKVSYYWDKKDTNYIAPYTDTFYKKNISGCDSMFILKLLELKPTKDTIRINFCDTNKNTGYSFDGKLFKKDTTYKAIYKNSDSCESKSFYKTI